MYVCLCKGLKEKDIALAARRWVESGSSELEDLFDVLGLHCEEACGYCVEHPEIIEAIASDEVESAGYSETRAASRPAQDA